MAYKDILVVLDDTPECAARVDVALGLARRHEAHLIGLLVIEPAHIPTYAMSQFPPEVMQARRRMEDEARAGSRQIRAPGRRGGRTVRVAHHRGRCGEGGTILSHLAAREAGGAHHGTGTTPQCRPTALNLEASRHIGESWQVELEARAWNGVEHDDPMSPLCRDDYVQLTVSRSL